MLAKILSGAVVGLESVSVTVEVDIAAQGLPSFTIVGLPDKAVEESRERVRSAIRNSGADFPGKRITVNLAPADLPKMGPAYDLPIALGILIASEQIPMSATDALYVGELSLDGNLRHTNAVLSMAMLAKTTGISSIFVPAIDAKEAAVIAGVSVYPVPSLLTLFHHLRGGEQIAPHPYIPFSSIKPPASAETDMADVHGQDNVKRALTIAAAGGHNIYLHGPPGAGKTMMARAAASILPSLTEKEALEVTTIYSVTGNLPPGESIMKYRPFRAPHHTTSRIGLIGGGAHPMPGEISLAHRGVLFLDEFPEFPRHVLEALRQPMEDGIVTIARAKGTVAYPAKFILIAAANPCPCGNLGSSKPCRCLPGAVHRYKQRVSGPILDRIDLHVHVPMVDVDKLTQSGEKAESSASIQKKVQRARDRQLIRLSSLNITSNAEMSTRMVKLLCSLAPVPLAFLRQAVSKYGLSARSYYRILKVSQTIADLDNSDTITEHNLAEAVMYRPENASQ